MQIGLHKLLCMQISVRVTQKQKIVEEIKEGYFLELSKIFIQKA